MKTLLVIAFVICFSVATSAQTDKQTPTLVLKDTRGRVVRLSDYKGKVVLLNFWATWCPPCRAEMPDLVKWQREFQSKGLQVLGVTYPPTRLRDVHEFTRKIGVNYPVLLGTKHTKALFDASDTLPITIVIDREGRISDRIEGIMLPDEFEQKVKSLLQQR